MTEEYQPDAVPASEPAPQQPPAPPSEDNHDNMIPGFGAVGE